MARGSAFRTSPALSTPPLNRGRGRCPAGDFGLRGHADRSHACGLPLGTIWRWRGASGGGPVTLVSTVQGNPRPTDATISTPLIQGFVGPSRRPRPSTAELSDPSPSRTRSTPLRARPQPSNSPPAAGDRPPTPPALKSGREPFPFRGTNGPMTIPRRHAAMAWAAAACACALLGPGCGGEPGDAAPSGVRHADSPGAVAAKSDASTRDPRPAPAAIRDRRAMIPSRRPHP